MQSTSNMGEKEAKPTLTRAYNTSLPKLDLHASNLQLEWTRWLMQYKIFLRASNLEAEDDKRKVSLLLHHMGGDIIEIFSSFKVDLDTVKHDDLVKKFEEYFNPKKNVTMERNKFFNKKQTSQTIMEFITELKNLAATCEFQESDSMIRDIFICNMRPEFNYIKERLLEDGDLTLSKAIQIAQSLEASRQRVSTLSLSETHVQKVYQESRGRSTSRQKYSSQKSQPNQFSHSYHRSQSNNRSQSSHRSQSNHPSNHQSNQSHKCNKCGQVHRVRCPALGKTCAKCGIRNHFASMCRMTSIKQVIQDQDEPANNIQEFFVGSIDNSHNSWEIPVQINGKVIKAQVDTGSQVNILSRYMYSFLNLDCKYIQPCTNVRLMSYTKDNIPIVGKVILKSIIKNQEHEVEYFITSMDQKTLLGLPTCEKSGIIKRNCVTLLSNSKNGDYDELLGQFENLFQGYGLLPGSYSIPFDKTAPSHIDAPRKIPFKIKEKLRNQLDLMVDEGIISKVDKPCKYISSLVCVEKADKSLRVCLDPKYVNKYIVRSKLNIPTLDSLVAEMSGCKIFSVLDCKSGFWSLPLDKESSYLTAFNTEFGVYRFNRMPFGISIASEVFQHALQGYFKDIQGLKIYIDDILIFAKDKAQHDFILKQFLEKASQINLKLNKDKLQLGQASVKFLGHIISGEGIKPQTSKVQAIENMLPPTNVKELQRFLGVVNYLGKFISNLSQETVCMRSSLKKNVPWSWTPNHQAEFENLKKIITSVPVLTYYDPTKPITLSVDSSQDTMGAVLLHGQNPIAYASKSLTECQKRYSQIEKELLAILWGCLKFDTYIYGQTITVHTDHKPLISIFKKPLADVPCRLQRMMLKLQSYDLSVIHIPGKLMFIADTLSRAKIKDNNLPDHSDKILETLNEDLRVHALFLINSINVTDRKLEEIRRETEKDVALGHVKRYALDGWPLSKRSVEDTVRQFYNIKDDLHVIDGILFKQRSIVIPSSLRKNMLERMHVGHLGMSKTKQLVRGVIFWPGMNNDIDKFIESCAICLRHRRANTKQPLQPHVIPDLPWQKVGMDLFNLDSKNYLIIVDYYSQYFEVSQVNSYNAQTVVTQCKSIFSRHGIPCQIISDGGPPFNSHQFKEFCCSWHIDHQMSSPYYPKSNGLVERTIGSVKNIFKKCHDSSTDIYLGLLQFRNTPKSDGIHSPAMLLMSRQLRSNIPCSQSILKPRPVDSRGEKEKMSRKQLRMKTHHDKKAKFLPRVNLGENILFKENPNSKWVPATIVEEVVPCRSYTVKTPEGVCYRRNREHILKKSISPVSSRNNKDKPVPRKIRFDDNLTLSPLRPRSILKKPSRYDDYCT